MRPAMVAHLGRALAVGLPIVTTITLRGNGSVAHWLVTAGLVGGVWLACLNIGFASGRTTLSPLGPRVAATRGVLLELIVTTALVVWLADPTLGVGTSLALAGPILALAAAWETIVTSYVAPETRLLLVGQRESCSDLIRELTGGVRARFRLLGVVDDVGEEPDARDLVLGPPAELAKIVAATRPDLVVLAPGRERSESLADLLDGPASSFRVLGLAQFYEHAFGRVPLSHLTTAWFMGVFHLYQRPYTRFAKRTMDVVTALLLLLLTAPLFPLLALLVRLTPGPVIYSQVRVGENGREFTIYKFRTMRPNTEAPTEAVWATRDDPRATGPGRLMRRMRLDELPQIWNVLKGTCRSWALVRSGLSSSTSSSSPFPSGRADCS
jgi:hypothetical protein